jgi:hypothetical protein
MSTIGFADFLCAFLILSRFGAYLPRVPPLYHGACNTLVAKSHMYVYCSRLSSSKRHGTITASSPHVWLVAEKRQSICRHWIFFLFHTWPRVNSWVQSWLTTKSFTSHTSMKILRLLWPSQSRRLQNSTRRRGSGIISMLKLVNILCHTGNAITAWGPRHSLPSLSGNSRPAPFLQNSHAFVFCVCPGPRVLTIGNIQLLCFVCGHDGPPVWIHRLYSFSRAAVFCLNMAIF